VDGESPSPLILSIGGARKIKERVIIGGKLHSYSLSSEAMNLRGYILVICILVNFTACAAPTAHRNAENMQTTEFMVPGVSFDGEFYPPLESPKKLGVLVLGGSDGGIPSRRAKWIAEHGFPVLALAYFKTQRTPEYLDMIPLEYFDQPIDWLRKNKHTRGGRIVVIGESKGAELALLLATRKPEISGLVAFVPSAVVFQGMPKDYWPPRSSWSYRGEQIPFVPYDLSNLPDRKNILSIYRNSLKQQEAVKRALIPVARIKGPILLFSAADDRMWPSVEMSDMIVSTLRDHKFEYPFEHITYDHAGHTMTEYYMMGGTEEGNRKARLDSTERTLLFLNKLSGEHPPHLNPLPRRGEED
jgi:dienelactone hydrolase